MFFLTQTFFWLINNSNRAIRSLEGLTFQRFTDTVICNSKRVALMIRRLVRRLRATDKTARSSIQEKKIFRSFRSSYPIINTIKSLQGTRFLYPFWFRSEPLEPRGGRPAHSSAPCINRDVLVIDYDAYRGLEKGSPSGDL